MVVGCTGLKSGDVNSVCENSLVRQSVVIAAALARNIPVERYVDSICKIAAIAEPFLIDPLKPADAKGTVGAVKYDPIERSLAAARERGLVE